MDNLARDCNGRELKAGQQVRLLDMVRLAPSIAWGKATRGLINQLVVIDAVGQPELIIPGSRERSPDGRCTSRLLWIKLGDDDGVWIYDWLVCAQPQGLRALALHYKENAHDQPPSC